VLWYHLHVLAGMCSAPSAIVVAVCLQPFCELAALSGRVMRPDSFRQMQLLIGRMCLNFDLGGLLQGPVPASRACRPFCSSAVWTQLRPWRAPVCQFAGSFCSDPRVALFLLSVHVTCAPKKKKKKKQQRLHIKFFCIFCQKRCHKKKPY
jgi:hypothetical protein